MRAERFPGEHVLMDNIDLAVRAYFQSMTQALKAGEINDPRGDMEDWEDHNDMVVGWVLGIQTLGHDNEIDDDVDGLFDVVSEGMSQYTALGVTQTLASWFEAS